ncbi:MAG: DUF4443 domain-containing protein [Candidatus Bathyarchaeia archaeon]
MSLTDEVSKKSDKSSEGCVEDLRMLELLVYLKAEQAVGRYRLKDLLGMRQNEWVVRRMLSQLAQKGLVRPTRSGSILTNDGRRYVDQTLERNGIVDIKEVNLDIMEVGPKSVAVQVRDRKSLPSLLTLRDEAVKAGAKGAVVFIYRNGDLSVPYVYRSILSRYPEVFHDLKKKFTFCDGDIMIVGFAAEISGALAGALAVALAMRSDETDI